MEGFSAFASKRHYLCYTQREIVRNRSLPYVVLALFSISLSSVPAPLPPQCTLGRNLAVVEGDESEAFVIHEHSFRLPASLSGKII